MANKNDDLTPFHREFSTHRSEQYARDVFRYDATYNKASKLVDALGKLIDGKRTPVDDVQHFRNVHNSARIEIPTHREHIDSHHGSLAKLPGEVKSFFRGLFSSDDGRDG